MKFGVGLEQNWGREVCAIQPGPKTATGHITSVTDRQTNGRQPIYDNSSTVTKIRTCVSLLNSVKQKFEYLY